MHSSRKATTGNYTKILVHKNMGLEVNDELQMPEMYVSHLSSRYEYMNFSIFDRLQKQTDDTVYILNDNHRYSVDNIYKCLKR